MDSTVSLAEQARTKCHRVLLVLSGSEHWAAEQAEISWQQSSGRASLWVGIRPEKRPSIRPEQLSSWLGRELDLTVYNASAGFDADVFGQLCGTLRGGGVMILLVPEFHKWPSIRDPLQQRLQPWPDQDTPPSGHFVSRLIQIIEKSPFAKVVKEEETAATEGAHTRAGNKTNPENHNTDEPYRTEEQNRAVQAVMRVVTGHRRRPLVLTAGRGRGKSASLGIASAKLFQAGYNTILVTAPCWLSVKSLFDRAHLLLEDSVLKGKELHWQGCTLSYIAPDRVIEESARQCNLMLVDEAAALPVSLLTRLLERYSRIVFSSTTEGYEGNGQGFATRFHSVLCDKAPQWKALQLRQPIRWDDDDPLESFVYQALLLDARPASIESLSYSSVAQCRFEKLEQSTLATDEPLLAELFGLLVLAHYRTRPSDLRLWLDGTAIEIFCLRSHGHVVAVAILAREGAIDADCQQAIWLGKRRLHGHLLPQSLSNHCGIVDATQFRCLRVVRLAVHPSLQRKGLGSALLGKIEQNALERGFDYMGCSFGATGHLIEFWNSSGYSTVRTGLKREASSGCFPVMMLKPLGSGFSSRMTEVSERFLALFHLHLLETLKTMEPGVVRRILNSTEKFGVLELSEEVWREAGSFAQGGRLYECCQLAVRSVLLFRMHDPMFCRSVREQTLNGLVVKVLQGNSWSELAAFVGLSGSKQAVGWLRRAVAQLL